MVLDKGNELIQVPDNVYIISPCMDDLSWSKTYWMGGLDENIKACNKLDYENLGGALDNRCLVDQLTPFERMALYSNKGYLSDNYSVESIRRISTKGNYGTAQKYNSLIRNTTDKALMYEFPKLTPGIDMNKVFQDVCHRGSNNFKTDGCTRFCVNGPGTYVKNQTFSGSYLATERLYGSKIRYFKHSTGETVEVILKGRDSNNGKKKADPEGWKKVEEAVKSASQELKDKVINNTTLTDILFYYKNFGIKAFKNPKTNVLSRDKQDNLIQNTEPLLIFLGDPCRADVSVGLGGAEKYFIDFTLKKSDKQYNELLNEMMKWFNDTNMRAIGKTIIKIGYLEPKTSRDGDSLYIPGLNNAGSWRGSNITQKMIHRNNPRPSSLRSSTNIATDYVSIKGENRRFLVSCNR